MVKFLSFGGWLVAGSGLLDLLYGLRVVTLCEYITYCGLDVVLGDCYVCLGCLLVIWGVVGYGVWSVRSCVGVVALQA